MGNDSLISLICAALSIGFMVAVAVVALGVCDDGSCGGDGDGDGRRRLTLIMCWRDREGRVRESRCSRLRPLRA